MEAKYAATLPPTLNPEQRITIEQVEILTGKKKSQIRRDVKSGVLPEPERYGRKCVRWRAGSVIDSMNRFAAKSEAA